MRQKERLCNNPEPKYLGKTCEEQELGPGIETESCNPDPCPGNFILIMLKTILKKKTNLKQVPVLINGINLEMFTFDS